jgi:prevent-host-death family protein
MKNRQVTATEFKAKCLALLDEVNEQRDTITITKRGRPVAMLQPVKRKPWKSLEGIWAGKVEIVGDIVNFSLADYCGWDLENMPEYAPKVPGRGKVSPVVAKKPRAALVFKRRPKSS